jgi:hypothetical protein
VLGKAEENHNQLQSADRPIFDSGRSLGFTTCEKIEAGEDMIKVMGRMRNPKHVLATTHASAH